MQQKIGDEAVEAFFLKHERASHEAEYRFIWFAEGQLQPFIDLKCLPATKFCERMVPPSTATP
jgi:hypothetical protein